MRRLSSGSIAGLLTSAVLVLGTCGGDDEKDTTGAGTGAQATTETATTGTDKTTTGEDRTTTREDRTSTRERDKSGRKRKRGRGSDDSSGSGGGGGSGSGTPATQPGDVRKIAKQVCSSFLPNQVARDLERDKRDEEDVARDYSRGFPEKQRERAYEGCLAGLKSR